MRTAVAYLRRHWITLLSGGVVLALSLAPWIRNRGLLRDFFDYGLMMVVNGRLADGARPFVDINTPLQSLSYLLNFYAERLFGGTYQAMTMGNGVFIVLSVVALFAMLLRRFSVAAAAVMTGTLIVGSLSQHTVIWYNGIGVMTLAAIGWAGAMAPVLKRNDWSWHLIVALGLLLSGVNKLNYHAVGLVAAVAWPLRAGLLGHASWTRVSSTVLLWLAMGLAAPLALELAWTGATWEQWRYNVIDSAFRERGGNLLAVFTWDFYLTPMHDYYHATLRPLGAIFVGWLVLALAVGWRGRSALDRMLLTGSLLFAFGGVAGLTATNHEIGYVSLAAGMTLLVGVWLGFELPTRGWLPRLLLVAPMLALGGVMWHSAWLGQRALFGHSQALRENYREVRAEGGQFTYLRGTRIPPEMAEDLEQLSKRLGAVKPGETHPFFFGAGVEWLSRVWPTERIEGLPSLMAPLVYGPSEINHLQDVLAYPSDISHVVGMRAWSDWPGNLKHFVESRSLKSRVGQFELWELHAEGMLKGLPPRQDAVMVINNFGGNLDGQHVTLEQSIRPMSTQEGRSYLGTDRGEGTFSFDLPVYKVAGEVALRRMEKTASLDEPLTATFALQILDETTKRSLATVWTQTITLPAGETQMVQSCEADTQRRPFRMVVIVSEESSGKLAAGWFVPRIQHTGVDTQHAPRLRLPSPGDVEGVDASWIAAIFPEGWRDDIELVVRNGRLTSNGVTVDRGGELWFRSRRPIEEWIGHFWAEPTNVGWNLPVPRVVWYDGGRLEIVFQAGIEVGPEGKTFKAWSPELEGWFGFLVDDNEWKAGAIFKVDSITTR